MINIVAFLGPSGAGKSTLQKELGLGPVVTWTSRPPRHGEVNGVNYHFTSKDCILDMLNQGILLEHTEYKGNLYATPLESIHSIIARKEVCSIVLDANGIRELKRRYDYHVLILGVFAPFEECRERLLKRNITSVEERLSTYHEEIAQMQLLSDLIINNSMSNWSRNRNILQLLLQGINGCDGDDDGSYSQ